MPECYLALPRRSSGEEGVTVPISHRGSLPTQVLRVQSPVQPKWPAPGVCNDDAPETPKENMKVRLFPKKKKTCKLIWQVTLRYWDASTWFNTSQHPQLKQQDGKAGMAAVPMGHWPQVTTLHRPPPWGCAPVTTAMLSDPWTYRSWPDAAKPVLLDPFSFTGKQESTRCALSAWLWSPETTAGACLSAPTQIPIFLYSAPDWESNLMTDCSLLTHTPGQVSLGPGTALSLISSPCQQFTKIL